MKKKVFYTEIAYILALALLAVGTALTAYGGLGISMVVAPAYVLHLKLSQFSAFFTFGATGYMMQALVLLTLLILLRRVKAVYFLSFLVAVCQGLALDGAVALTGFLPGDPAVKVILYIAGALLCCAGLGFMFATYLPPEVYELFVKELSAKLHKRVTTVKTIFDCSFLLLSILLSLLFFGEIRGIGIGTVLCALLYGVIIRMFQNIYHKVFLFRDKFPLRKYFEERT